MEFQFVLLANGSSQSLDWCYGASELLLVWSKLRLTRLCYVQHLQGTSEEDSEGSMSGDDSDGTPDPLASDDEMEGESESQTDNDQVRAGGKFA